MPCANSCQKGTQCSAGSKCSPAHTCSEADAARDTPTPTLRAAPRSQPHFLVPGSATGPLLYTDTPLSFWGGVDPVTGVVIDVHHPLHNQALWGKVLALPYGRGSCSGSLGVLELLFGGKGPAAIIFSEPDAIIALGALVGEVVFGTSVPVVAVGRAQFANLSRHVGQEVCIDADGLGVGGARSVPLAALDDAEVELSDTDAVMLAGDNGRAAQQALRLVVAAAKLYGASRLLSVSSAHIDACIYVGPATLRFAQHFASLGGHFAVPTTLNAVSVDLEQWRSLGVDPELGAPAQALADAYLALGADARSLTCAPYLLASGPRRGDDIGWAESNAVLFANSVLGARTQKNPDMLDVCIALTGRAPLAGMHRDELRVPVLAVHVDAALAAVDDDALWPLVGYAVGSVAGKDIPVVLGLERRTPRIEDLKAFGAAFGTTGSAPLFHIAGITPEAGALEAAAQWSSLRQEMITRREIAAAWMQLNSAHDDTVALVAFGNPHLSLGEFASLAALVAGRHRADGTNVVLTCGRVVRADAEAAGHVATLREFGATILEDTCWCMVREPFLPPPDRNVMTNSAKYAHYGASERGMHFAGMAECVDAAVEGRRTGGRGLPRWLGGAEVAVGIE